MCMKIMLAMLHEISASEYIWLKTKTQLSAITL